MFNEIVLFMGPSPFQVAFSFVIIPYSLECLPRLLQCIRETFGFIFLLYTRRLRETAKRWVSLGTFRMEGVWTG